MLKFKLNPTSQSAILEEEIAAIPEMVFSLEYALSTKSSGNLKNIPLSAQKCLIKVRKKARILHQQTQQFYIFSTFKQTSIQKQ